MVDEIQELRKAVHKNLVHTDPRLLSLITTATALLRIMQSEDKTGLGRKEQHLEKSLDRINTELNKRDVPVEDEIVRLETRIKELENQNGPSISVLLEEVSAETWWDTLAMDEKGRVLKVYSNIGEFEIDGISDKEILTLFKRFKKQKVSPTVERSDAMEWWSLLTSSSKQSSMEMSSTNFNGRRTSSLTGSEIQSLYHASKYYKLKN